MTENKAYCNTYGSLEPNQKPQEEIKQDTNNTTLNTKTPEIKPIQTKNKPIKKRRKSKVSKEKAIKYAEEYLTNGFNKTKAVRAVYGIESANNNCTQNHRIMVNNGVFDNFEEFKTEVIRKAWNKVFKALDKNTDKADGIARDLATKDMKILTDITTHDNISPNTPHKDIVKELETSLERLKGEQGKGCG